MHKLQEAFREAAGREFAMVPAESELDYRFSRRFERSMRRIIHAQVHGYWMMVNTAAKRAAVAAAIILLLLTSALAIKPIRERVIQFFVEVYEDYFEIRFGREEKDEVTKVKIGSVASGVDPIALLDRDEQLVLMYYRLASEEEKKQIIDAVERIHKENETDDF